MRFIAKTGDRNHEVGVRHGPVEVLGEKVRSAGSLQILVRRGDR